MQLSFFAYFFVASLNFAITEVESLINNDALLGEHEESHVWVKLSHRMKLRVKNINTFFRLNYAKQYRFLMYLQKS